MDGSLASVVFCSVLQQRAIFMCQTIKVFKTADANNGDFLFRLATLMFAPKMINALYLDRLKHRLKVFKRSPFAFTIMI